MRNEAPVQECADALSEWLPAALGERNIAKKLARKFDSKPDTARQWVRGHGLPQWPTFVAMVQEWGRPFLDHIFEPAINEDGHVRLRHRLANLRAELALLDRELEELEARAPYYEEIYKSDQLDLPLFGGGVCADCQVLPFTERGNAAGGRQIRTA